VRKLLFAVATALASVAICTPASAEMTDFEILFVRTDENGDFVLSKAEVLRIAILQFEIADANANEMLEAEEVGELAEDPEFSDNDADGDGSLSIDEMIEEKLADFKDIDADSDGKLTLEELKTFYEVE
jgi:Ca2+-binding EF-hand superfamily protein